MRLLYSSQRKSLIGRCLDEMNSRAAADAGARSILVVPEQTKMDMERAFLSHPAHQGLMLTEILSFRRLAWRLLGELGLNPSSVIDPVGQAMLIHRVLRQNQSRLFSFGHLADKPGFVREAADALGDLKRYQISPQDLLAASAKADRDRALENKTHDLAILLDQYTLALSETGLADAEDDLNRLAGLLQKLAALPGDEWPWPWKNLAWLRQSSIWVCGFAELRDFTPQEDAILTALERLAGQLTLTITADHIPFDRLSVDQGADHLLIGRRSAWRLAQRFPACRIECLEDRPGLAAHSEQPLLRQNLQLSLVQASFRDDELSFVAGEIRRLVQTEGYRYQDITLAVCDLQGYASDLQAACREYDIPLFLDRERSLGGTPLARLVLGLLDCGIFGWTRHSTMTCLRSGFCGLDPDEADRLENEWLARGLFRPGRLFDDKLYVNEDLLILRDRALLPLRDFLLKLRAVPEGEGKCRLLGQFLLDYGLPEKLRRRTDVLLAEGEREAAVTQVQAWNELVRILDQMMRLIGPLHISLPVFRDMLAAGMDSASGGVIPTAVDQIAAGSLKRAMLRPCRALFVIGATAAWLPPPLPSEGLLKDQDRQQLSAALQRQLPSSARDQVFADAFTIHALLELPERRLYLTAPDTETANLFRLLAKQQPEAVHILPERPDAWDARLNGLRPAYRGCLGYRSLSQNGQEEPFWAGLAAILEGCGLRLPPAEDHGARGPVDVPELFIAAGQDGRIAPELVRALYGDNVIMSVSQLERYAGCPFQHLATNLLALQERKVWQPQATETGTLLHGVIELALRDLRQDLAEVDPTDDKGRQAILQRWLDSDLAGRTRVWMEMAALREDLQRIFEAGLYVSVGRKAERQAAASLRAILRQFREIAYRPAFLEWVFGPGQPDGLTISLPDGSKLALRGKIDRVDLLDGDAGGRFRIIDYKSGNRAADFDSLYSGLSLQLPVYLEAFRLSRPVYQPEDAAYFHFDRPILRLEAGQLPNPDQLERKLDKCFALKGLALEPPDLALLCRHSLRKAAESAAALLSGDFAVAPRKLPGRPAACATCPLIAVCGFDGKPDGYVRLAPLGIRLGESGKPMRKRQAMVAYLRESANNRR